MQGRGVRYHIKHSGEFLYKISNEDDYEKFKVTKIRMPQQLNAPRVKLEATTVTPEKQDLSVKEAYTTHSFRLNKNEIAPVSDYLKERKDFLLSLPDKELDSLTGIQTSKIIYEAEEGENVLEFEVFKNYLAMIVERQGQRQLRTISLKTESVSTHYFDSAGEVCPVNGDVSEFFEASLHENLTFDSNYVKYQIQTPSTLTKTLDYFMSTRRVTDILSEEHITNYRRDNLLCEKVDMQMRDGTLVPVVMVYDKRFYTEESSWVLFTKGIDSEKSDLALSPHRLSLTDRGIVCAFPMVRGTRFFDTDWLLSGAGERKAVHFNDLIDTAIFIKDNELATKICIQASDPNGSLSAMASVFKEPFLFEGVAIHNPLTDIPQHLMEDINKRSFATQKRDMQIDKIKMAKLMEFGNIAADQLAYENVLKYSPYHMPLDIEEARPITNILITCDEDWPYKYHARKLICKIREASVSDPLFALYHEFPSQMYNEQQKDAEHFSFLIDTLRNKD